MSLTKQRSASLYKRMVVLFNSLPFTKLRIFDAIKEKTKLQDTHLNPTDRLYWSRR